MGGLGKALVAVGIAGLASGLGFISYAESVKSLERRVDGKVDAIVVLTGDEERISTGMVLMEAGYARRLLISGVHPTTRVPTELRRHVKGSEALVRCCVDIGHEALNTSGNAEEARHWAQARGFKSLLVVTSSYHLARSLTEFRRAMPEARIAGYPAAPGRNLRLDGWWRHWPTVRLLAGEYVKLVGAKVRYAIVRLVGERRDGPAPAAPRPPSGHEAPRTVGVVR